MWEREPGGRRDVNNPLIRGWYMETVFWEWTSKLWKTDDAGLPFPSPGNHWTPTAFGETWHGILIISVDVFLSTSLGLSSRQSLTWYLLDLSRTSVIRLTFSVCFSLVSLVCPHQGLAWCWFPWRRPLCFHPIDSGWDIPPTTAHNNT